jgi:hypothetical protein
MIGLLLSLALTAAGPRPNPGVRPCTPLNRGVRVVACAPGPRRLDSPPSRVLTSGAPRPDGGGRASVPNEGRRSRRKASASPAGRLRNGFPTADRIGDFP